MQSYKFFIQGQICHNCLLIVDLNLKKKHTDTDGKISWVGVKKKKIMLYH